MTFKESSAYHPLLSAIDHLGHDDLVHVLAKVAARLQTLPARAPAPLIDPDLIPLGEIAKRIGKSKDALRKWADRNGILVKIMGRLYVHESSLRALLNKST